mmetsp:Transcript_23748/g.60002  ORF Transcript_23748/g.60002 Transcript_23748/m.60002 type:complete len:842 (+) Transcript_23748:67-2592(+)
MSVLFPAGSSRVSLGEGGSSRFNAALPTLDFSKMTFSAAPAQPFQFYPAEVMPSSSLPGGDEQEVMPATTVIAARMDELGQKRHSQFVQSSSYHYETDGGYNKQTGAASTAQPSSSATSSNSGDGDFGKMTFAAVDVSKGLWQLPNAGVEEFKEVLAEYERLMAASLAELWPPPKDEQLYPVTAEVPPTAIFNADGDARPQTKFPTDHSPGSVDKASFGVEALQGFEGLGHFDGDAASLSPDAASSISPPPSPDIDKFLRETDHMVKPRETLKLQEEQADENFASVVSWAGSAFWSAMGQPAAAFPRSMSRARNNLSYAVLLEQQQAQQQHHRKSKSFHCGPTTSNARLQTGGPLMAKLMDGSGGVNIPSSSTVPAARPLRRPPPKPPISFWVRSNIDPQLGEKESFAEKAVSVFDSTGCGECQSGGVGVETAGVSSGEKKPCSSRRTTFVDSDGEVGGEQTFGPTGNSGSASSASSSTFDYFSASFLTGGGYPAPSSVAAVPCRPEEGSGQQHQKALTSTLLKSINCSVSCRKGHKPGTANHDAFSVMHFSNSKWGALRLLAVYDGHGKFGEVTSQVASNLMMKMFLKELDKLKIDEQGPGFVDNNVAELQALGRCMENTFEGMHLTLEALTTKTLKEYWPGEGVYPETLDARESGTTATLILTGLGPEDHPWLLIGHIGDGKAVLYKKDEGRFTALTKDHRPDSPEEKARVEQTGLATIESFFVSRGTVRPWDPRIVTSGQTWPALNMSRVFGDLHAHKQGVTWMPDVRLLDAKKGDVLCVATDGVWDVFEDVEELGPYLASDTEETTAAAIARAAKERWNKQLDDGFHDDITCIVMEL